MVQVRATVSHRQAGQSRIPGVFPYRVSKAAMYMLATEWARLLREDAVNVFNVSPGFLNTGLGDNQATGEWRDKRVMGAIGAAFCAYVIQGKRDEQTWPPQVLRKGEV